MKKTESAIHNLPEGIEVTLDIYTVEHITTRYLMEVYIKTQEEIARFIQNRIDGKAATFQEWQDYNGWHESSDDLRNTLRSIMASDEYKDFVEKVYKKLYPPRKGEN